MEPVRTPESQRLQEIHGKMMNVKTQRDSRTSLHLKKAYVILPFILTLLVFIVIGGISSVHNTHLHCNTSTVDGFRYFSYMMIAVGVILLCGNIFAIANPAYMWLTSTVHRQRWYGEDVEDPDPFILARKGHFLAAQSSDNLRMLNELVDEDHNNI